ncbi:MAG: 4-(cytidine 5'-diphospho)-2-C-methyl-D-erythritol kinase [Bacteroidales bacterium]
MIDFPPAKINLGLRVIRRRDDGYHDLFTVFYPIPWHDVLEILPSDGFSFHSYGLVIPGEASDNLVVKAWQLLHATRGIPPVSIHLMKNIPMGAGLGGGSSDAAYALRMLDQLFELHISAEEMKVLALQLGSDCPFFLHPQPCSASGRGEVLQPLDFSLKDHFLVMVKPEIHISTRDAYGNIQPCVNPHPAEILRQPKETWREALVNDFEAWALQAYPELIALKQALYDSGAFYASMSGSGSAFYGLFDIYPALSEKIMLYKPRILRLRQ